MRKEMIEDFLENDEDEKKDRFLNFIGKIKENETRHLKKNEKLFGFLDMITDTEQGLSFEKKEIEELGFVKRLIKIEIEKSEDLLKEMNELEKEYIETNTETRGEA